MKLPAIIFLAERRAQIACIVADMSGTGAKIELSPAAVAQVGSLEQIPARFTLILRTDRMQVDCEVMWRRLNQIGVRFLGAPQPMGSTGKR